MDAGNANSVFLGVTLRLAMAIAETKKLRPTVMTTRHGTLQERTIVKSFAVCRLVTTLGTMIAGGLTSALGVWRCFNRIRSGAILVRLSIGGHAIGKHIYDLLLRRHGQPKLGALSIKERMELAAEIAYFFGLRRLFKRERFSFAILGDNAYRQGMTAEILKQQGIPSLVGIDLNGLAAHLYRDAQAYSYHCRTPDAKIVTALDCDPAIQSFVVRELDVRTSGKEPQHDVVRAYSIAKRDPTPAELRQRIGANADQKLVLVMAHIFQDAPHAYPDNLFRDYSQWLVETCRRLQKNQNVVFLVKEHPSTDLYAEEGVLDALLSELGPQKVEIVRDVNTKSFFRCADVVVTCGGTCGLEFPCFGVPVVVGARPPYSEFPYVWRPATRHEYYALLDDIHDIPKLSPEQIHLARTVFYTLQVAQKVDKSRLGLGTQGYGIGSPPSAEQAWKEMAEESIAGAGYNRLLAYVDALLDSDFSNMMDFPYLAGPSAVFDPHSRTMPVWLSSGLLVSGQSN